MLTVSDNSIEVSDVIINNSNNSTINNISTTFVQLGQNVIYTFYAYNVGEYIAYLNNIIF